LKHESAADRVIRALIERQRRLVNSDYLSERLRIFWLAALLDERLADCTDRQIAELMDYVLERFGIFEPEMAVCRHARHRLFRSTGVSARRQSTNRQVEGE
jgi:hypothetical protein